MMKFTGTLLQLLTVNTILREQMEAFFEKMPSPTRPLNNSMSSSLSEQLAAPSRASEEQQRTRPHCTYTIQPGIIDTVSKLLKKKGIHTIQNPFYQNGIPL
jgi:hypothetical protein